MELSPLHYTFMNNEEKKHTGTNSSCTDHSAISKPVKIFSANRRVRKLIGVSSYADLEIKCKEKFGVADGTPVSFVLDEDGFQIDFDGFGYIQPNSILMILVDEEEWHPKGTSGESHEDCDREEGPVTKKYRMMVEALKQKTLKYKAAAATGKKKIETHSYRIGWLHFNMGMNKFTPVRSSLSHPSAGPKTKVLRDNLTYEETIKILNEEYFPGGKNFTGKLKNMTCRLGTAKGTVIENSQNFNLYNYRSESECQKGSIYLLTKEKILDIEGIATASSDSDFELPEPACLSFRKSPTDGNLEVRQPYQQQPMPGPSCLPDHLPVINWSNVNPGVSAIRTPVHEKNQNTTQFMDTDTPTVQFRINEHLQPVQQNNVQLCPVCFDKDLQSFMQPCGHTFCTVCAVQAQSMKNQCPTCRGQIHKVSPLYL